MYIRYINKMILGLDTDTFYALVLLLLLIILGLVTFQYYFFISGKNGLSFGTGLGVNLLPQRTQ